MRKKKNRIKQWIDKATSIEVIEDYKANGLINTPALELAYKQKFDELNKEIPTV
jgi:hypothetical protein